LQSIIQNFITTADDSGARKISSALKDVSKDINSANESSKPLGTGLDNIAGKLGYMGERKLGNIVFRDIALGAVGASSSVNTATSATEALTAGLEILGRVGLGFSGTIGLAILAVTAFATIIEKLNANTKQTPDSVKKTADAYLAQSKAAKEAATSLEQLNVISKDQEAGLKNTAALSRDNLKALQDEIAFKEKLVTARVRNLTAQLQENNEGGKGLSLAIDLNKAIEIQTKLRAELIALGSTGKDLAKDQNDATVKQINLQALNLEQAEKIRVDNISYIQLLQEKSFHEATVLDLEKKLNDTENENAKNVITAQIDGIKKLIEIDNKKVEQLQANAKKIEAMNKQVANEIVRGANAVASGWEIQNGKLVYSTAKAASQIIGIVAQQIETQLAMAAARDLSNPATFALGVAEAAGVGVVASLAGAAGALLGADNSTSSPSGSSVSSPSGASSASSGGSSGSTQQNTNLIVEIRGGYFDQQAADNLAKMLSKRVQQGNIRLVSSTVLSNVGQNPG
jgi:hypothetical protein